MSDEYLKRATVTRVVDFDNGDAAVSVEIVREGRRYPWRAEVVTNHEYHNTEPLPLSGDEEIPF